MPSFAIYDIHSIWRNHKIRFSEMNFKNLYILSLLVSSTYSIACDDLQFPFEEEFANPKDTKDKMIIPQDTLLPETKGTRDSPTLISSGNGNSPSTHPVPIIYPVNYPGRNW